MKEAAWVREKGFEMVVRDNGELRDGNCTRGDPSFCN